MWLLLLLSTAFAASDGWRGVGVDQVDSKAVALALGGNNPLVLVPIGPAAEAMSEAVVDNHQDDFDLRVAAGEPTDVTDDAIVERVTAAGAECGVWLRGDWGAVQMRLVGTCEPPNTEAAAAYAAARLKAAEEATEPDKPAEPDKPKIAEEDLPDANPPDDLDNAPTPPGPSPKKVLQATGIGVGAAGVVVVLATWGVYAASPSLGKGEWNALKAINTVGWGLAAGGAATFGVGSFAVGKHQGLAAPSGLVVRVPLPVKRR